MKSKLKIVFPLGVLATLFLLTSCEKETVSPSDHMSDMAIDVRNNGNGNGNGGGNGGGNGNGNGNNNDVEGEVDPDPIEYDATYQITEYDEFDALYRFSICVEGDLMLLQTDSTITHWGTGYWGAWADPYPYADGIVHYIKGLSEVTYEFVGLPGDMLDVSKTLSVTDYLSGHVTTTYKHIGIYSRTSD
jgi:hypothetical protein